MTKSGSQLVIQTEKFCVKELMMGSAVLGSFTRSGTAELWPLLAERESSSCKRWSCRRGNDGKLTTWTSKWWEARSEF